MATLAPRIWLTRSEAGNRLWSQVLQAAGYRFGCLPTLEFEVLASGRAALVVALRKAQWALFLSPRGVQAAASLGAEWHPNLRLACVGPKTAEALQEAGARADWVAKGGSGGALAHDLLRLPGWQKAALVCAETSHEEPLQSLRAAGKQVVVCPVYRTLQRTLAATGPAPQPGDVVFVASPSAVGALQAQKALDPGLVWISIGPSTSTALRRAGLEPSAEATARTLEGLLSAMHQKLLHHER